MNNLYFEIIAFFYIMREPAMLKNFKKKFFSEPTIVAIFDTVKYFIDEYKTEPTADQVVELLKIENKDDIQPINIHTLWESKKDVSKYSEDWLKTNITSWGKFRSFRFKFIYKKTCFNHDKRRFNP